MTMTIIKKLISILYFKFCNTKNQKRFSLEEKGDALSALLKRMTDFELAVKILQTRRFTRPISPTFLKHPEGNRFLILSQSCT